MTRRVAIIGFVPDSLKEAPLDDRDVEQWGFNASQRLVEPEFRFARWYELHAFPKLDEDIPYLKDATIPVFMQQPHPEVPMSRAFPKDEVLALAKYPYFTNSISFLIGHAILEGVDELGLYGVDMAVFNGDGPSEIEEQRPSVEYLLGIAIGRGMKVIVPDSCDLLKTSVLYGYDDHIEATNKRIRERVERLKRRVTEYARDLAYVQGLLDEAETERQRFFTDRPSEK